MVKSGHTVAADAPTPLDSLQTQPSKRERRMGVVFSALAFFVSYIITAGPAAFLTRAFDQPMFESIVRTIYAPLVFIIKAKVPILAPAIKAWVELFQ